MKWTLISAVSSEEVLKSCLLNSPESQSASEVMLQTGYTSAAAAYNDAIRKAKTDVLVFAHQDVYLPEGWVAALEKALEALASQDPDWGVAGVWGIDSAGRGFGNVYCTFSMQQLGGAFEGGVRVRTLDEVMLIFRKSSGLLFDERMGGFHMYGSDICLAAERGRRKCYVISALCVHNSNGYRMLPLEFWKCFFFMRRKWRAELPIVTPCARITFWCWPVIRWNIVRALNLLLKRNQPGRRVPDPGKLYRDHFPGGPQSARPCVTGNP